MVSLSRYVRIMSGVATGVGLTAQEFFRVPDPLVPFPDGRAWTPNYLGAGFVRIPEWSVTNGVVEFDLLLESLVDQNFIAPSGANSFLNPVVLTLMGGEFGSSSNELVTTLINEAEINRGVNGGLFAEINTIYRVRINIQQLAGVSVIGASSTTTNPFSGQLTNLRLTDLEDPSNSRFYRSVRFSETMPDSTILEDLLGDGTTNGVLENFPAAQRWVPVLGTDQAYLGNRQDQSYNNGIDITRMIVSSWPAASNIRGSWENSRPSNGSLLIFGNDLLQITGAPNSDGFDAFYAIASGTNEEIQSAFEYPNIFNIDPFDSATEFYVSDREGDGYSRGVNISTNRISFILGSNQGSDFSRISVNVLLQASNGATLRVITDFSNGVYEYTVITGTPEQIQQGFQWPNHFAITPP